MKKNVKSGVMPLVKIAIVDEDGCKDEFILLEDYLHGDEAAESFFRNVANMLDMRVAEDGSKRPMPFSTCIYGLNGRKLMITRTQDVLVERE